MSAFDVAIYVLKFCIPSVFSLLFRGYGLGYRSKTRFALGLAAYAVYMAVVPSALILLMGYGQFTHISSIVMTLSGVFVLIFSTDTVGKTIFLHLVQGSMVTALSVLLNMVRHLLGLSYLTLDVLLLVASPILCVVALRFWAKPLRFLADNIHSNILTMSVIPLLNMVLVYFLPVFPAQNFANHPVYCTVMMLLVEFGFFLYLYTFYRNLLKIKLLLESEAKGQLLAAEIESYQESLAAAKQTRHDLHHHNALIVEYLETGNTAGAMEYLRANDRTLVEARLAEFSQNPAANAVLRIYSRQAQAKDIVFSALADLPEGLPLEAPELGALLSNLLENAVEACAPVALHQRQIALSAQKDGQRLLLELRNSVSGTVLFEDGMPRSQKPGGGTGTKSILHITQKYGGMCQFKQEDGMFFTRIVLPLKG